MPPKKCFIDKARPCDLTCKAATPVDDPVDPVDCHFILLAAHMADGLFDFRRMLEVRGFEGGPEGEAGPGDSPPEGGGGDPPISNN